MAVAVQRACSGMLPPDHFGQQAVPRKDAPSPPKKKQSGDAAGFTFVDQSADFRSLADKKIVDSDQRHLIRSHVMKTVRENERLRGKKRPTGRDGARKPSSSAATVSTPNLTQVKSLPGSSVMSDASSRTSSSSPTPLAAPNQTRQVAKIPRSPSQGKFNPFDTLPGSTDTSNLTDELIQYCFHTFIPMTFPIEATSPYEYNTRRIKVLQSQSANTATFFGLMAIVAAHRSILQKRHKDLSPMTDRRNKLLLDDHFGTMKSHALQATQERIARNGWDGPTVEAIFGLIGAEQILGNFEEARFHLTALRKFFMGGSGLDAASPASDWIPLTDVKGAIGTMSRPLFRLPWKPEPVPEETMEKLYRGQDYRASTLRSALSRVDGLGSQMKFFLEQASVLCRFCQFNAVHSQALTAVEHEMFRRKTLELEYDVLSYIYPGSPSEEKQVPNKIPYIEQITRLAVLGTTSSVITKVLPSAGVGRALTHFQHMAVKSFLSSVSHLPDPETLRFIVWALMIFAQCAHEQPEEPFFIDALIWCSRWTGLNRWEDLELVCSSFLYVPAFQRNSWYGIWNQVVSSHVKQEETRSIILSHMQYQQAELRPQNDHIVLQ